MAQLHDLEVDDYLADSVSIDPLSIEDEYVKVPALLAYHNTRYAEAMRAFRMAEMHAERLEAMLRIEHRERLIFEGVKVTESQVEAAVKLDDRYQQAQTEVVQAEFDKVRAYGIVDAVRTKRDMLVSLGAQIRAELNGAPDMRREHRDARAYRRPDDLPAYSLRKQYKPTRNRKRAYP